MEKVQRLNCIDTELLEKYISKSGYRKGYLKDLLGLSWEGFDRKRKGLVSFRGNEVYILVDVLKITNEDKQKIFCPNG